MKKRRSRFLVLTTIMAVFMANILTVIGEAGAKEIYPSGTITFIECTNPGGGMDISARGVATFLPRYLKEVSPGARGGEIVVKNVPQASGAKAYSDVFKSDPDGYTIGDFISGHLSDVALGTMKMPFDIRKFTWLLTSNQSVYTFISRKNGPKTWEEMLAAAKKEPLKWGVALYGSSIHVNSIWVKEEVGIPARFIILPGSAGLVSSVMRGDVDVALIPADSAKSIIQAKEANVLVTFSDTRYYPEVPTMIEKGFPQFLPNISGIRLVMAPPDLDPEARKILIAAAKKMVADPKYHEFCQKIGSLPSPLTGQEVADAVNNRIKFYGQISPILRKHLK